MDERIGELETTMACVVDLVVGGTSGDLANQPTTPGIPVSTRSADALRAHETIRSRTATYRQQLVDTPDFGDVCPECPDLDELSGQQISYWKAEYTKRGGKHAAWR